MRTSTRALLGLHLLLALYSVTNIFSKLASDAPFLSVRFVVFYGLVLLILAIYAIGWQQAIKRMPLTTAYANKAVTIVWGVIFGVLFFGETVTVPKVVGAVLIMAGVALFGIEDGRYQRSREDEMNAQLAGPERLTGDGMETVAGANACAGEEEAASGRVVTSGPVRASEDGDGR
jgi:multidrug transporter EmrE-like cation transporter